MQNGGQITMVSNKSISLGIAILIAFAGMALAVFPVVYQNAGKKEGSLVLTVLLILAGCITFFSYMKESFLYNLNQGVDQRKYLK